MTSVTSKASLGCQIQWNLFIMDKLVQELMSIIWRCPLLGGFIIVWVWLIAKIDDVIRLVTSQVRHMQSQQRD